MESWHGNGDAHVAADFVLCTCLFPDTYFVQSALPPLIVTAAAELEVAKGGKSGIGGGYQLALLGSVYIEDERIALDDDGYVVPTGSAGKDTAYVETAVLVSVPSH